MEQSWSWTDLRTRSMHLGGSNFVDSVDIAWKYPANAFSASASNDGDEWSQVYAADSNRLDIMHMELAGSPFAWIRALAYPMNLVLAP